MSEFTRDIGQNIRMYRRASRITLEELAERIHKSRASVGKYEQGSIALDADTLNELAQALRVTPAQLLAPPVRERGAVPPEPSEGSRGYLYLYDGRTSRVVRSLLLGADGETEDAALFYDIASFDAPQRCRALYCGRRELRGFVANYLLDSRSNDVEHVLLCVMRSLDRPTYGTGLLSGISARMFLPACAKCILSTEPLPENDSLRESLLLTREDIQFIRRYNMFMVEHTGV
ncbi:MAG: helix-turn-helix transcriptional regulator [Ruminococcaceae bacterium]|nr:helix-turn-helix transcriptional regulator [Oscillospiraceae bacterium]